MLLGLFLAIKKNVFYKFGQEAAKIISFLGGFHMERRFFLKKSFNNWTDSSAQNPE